ncbi:MAG: hypothetical protein IT450_11920 [Phycisphaerales bacterium]|nr:hypothetical protein [Phycisphaerales bacterium]
MDPVCQATRTEIATVEVPSQSPDGPYRLSAGAAERLRTYSLRPLEWFNLAAIHGTWEWYLHSGSYDEYGTACEQTVADAEQFPCPTLDDCKADVQRLFDFAIVKYDLEQPVIDALLVHRPNLLTAIRERFDGTRNTEFHYRIAEVAARTLGTRAEQWFAEILARAGPEERPGLLFAGHGCFPHERGFAASIDALSHFAPNQLAKTCHVLADFRDPRVLDWIEQHVSEPLTRQWGDLAAVSRMDWARVETWLASGRPLSLIALDAMVACIGPRPSQSLLIRRLAPRIYSDASAATMRATLAEYASRDRVPRVRAAVDRIFANLESLISTR